MEAMPWTLRVTVSLPTKVPVLGLKRTARESDWAGGEDSRLDEQASRTTTSTAWRARRVHVLLALDIRAIQFPRGSLEHNSGNGLFHRRRQLRDTMFEPLEQGEGALRAELALIIRTAGSPTSDA